MSRLSVFWPEETKSVYPASEERMIIPFPTLRQTSQNAPRKMDIITRARTLYENRKCIDCGYALVEPVELPDSTVNRSGLSIPGTATLVGFRCCGCQHEWSV